ncbi:MAG TPA: hypothetical protein VHY22_06705 [Chthoniobacteraceae bacterium]|jgi:Spy/CpxP family protein refolding chaperone|nr:hypothetical protein [Chthoniobacteraceae bacterium]
MASELNLNDDQKTKVKAIFDDARPQFQAVFHDNTLAPQDKMAKVKALRDATEAKIKPLLTPEQLQKLDQIHHPAQQPPQ